MKTLIADKFSEAHLARLTQLGCDVTYKPGVKAEELPGLIGPYKILVVRGKPVTAETLQASGQLALVLRAGAGVNTIDVKTASAYG
jgi:D-3-phosphoglycerate dehydrogenase